MVITNPIKTKELLTRGTEEVIVKESLEKKLKTGKQLRVKFGIDPTTPDLHLGHSVVLRKLRQFQDLGHKVILIIGDFTAQIGDPSGRSEERKVLTEKEIKKNLKDYLKQAGLVLNIKRAEIYHNSKWLARGEKFLLDLARRVSVQRILERDDFQKRIKECKEISFLEAFYPLLQGYDSVAVRADVEIGGTDQKFNVLMGRRIQRAFNLAEQDVLTCPLLEGTDGTRKMSKSYSNYIALTAEPADMYGKIMSIPDALIWKYFELLTDLSEEEITRLKHLENLRDAKMRLAHEIVKIYHGVKSAQKAGAEFKAVFQKKGLPSDIPAHQAKNSQYRAVDLLVETGLAPSKSEARRLIGQGGACLHGARGKEQIAKPEEIIKIKDGMVIQVGKRRFVKIKRN